MPKMPIMRVVAITVCLFVAVMADSVNANEPAWWAGVAKVDITPIEAVRMAGYGNRDRPSEGVDSPLSVRCVALRQRGLSAPTADDHSETLLLIAIDTIGLPGSLARQINREIEQRFKTPRQKIVLTSTHTHCGPDLISELSNIFSTPLTDDERAAGLRCKAKLVDAVVDAVATAIGDLKPAKLDYEVDKATFAANRRVLTGGRCSGDDAPATMQLSTDTNGNSRYDTATIFLDKIAFPTGVYPWRDGVIISAAPDILFARDTIGVARLRIAGKDRSQRSIRSRHVR